LEKLLRFTYLEYRLSTAEIMLLNPIVLTAQAGRDILEKTTFPPVFLVGLFVG
jgi:hypothetical protein